MYKSTSGTAFTASNRVHVRSRSHHLHPQLSLEPLPDQTQSNTAKKNTPTMSYKEESKLEEQLCKQIFSSSDAVCFDIDSTVCRDEAIDEIAIFANKEKEVMEL